MTKALILAAGEGTRLRPLTLQRPKPMLPIKGKPLLEYTVGWLRSHGVDQIAMNLHYKPETILEHFGDGRAFGVELTYSHERELLGTAGAVRSLKTFLEDDGPFVLVYGDVLTDLDLGQLLQFHRQAVQRDPSARITLSLYSVPNPTEVGLVDLAPDGKVLRFVEKPKAEEVFTDLANAGVLVIEPSVIEHIPADTFYDFGHDLFPKLLAAGESIYGWKIPDGTYLLDIGSPEKYAQAQQDAPIEAGHLS
ncbi:MAG: nucleotidyltransferase family protein [Caldilineaceae bacterium]|nr:nucleotidyltransferase family protein [Caldilineaceae bacterium]